MWVIITQPPRRVNRREQGNLFRDRLLQREESMRAHGCEARWPRWARATAVVTATAFLWSFVLARPAMALTSFPGPFRRVEKGSFGGDVRALTAGEMNRIVGRGRRQGSGGTATKEGPGAPYNWQLQIHGVNIGNGNKQTVIPIVNWTQRGGLPVGLSLIHNSEGTVNGELGHKWTNNYDISLGKSGMGSDEQVTWGDGLSYVFTYNVGGSYSPPTGIYDTLAKNGDGTFTLTTKDQIAYHFATLGYCDTITDENGNAITLAHNASNQLTSITDATSRAVTLTYTSGEITGIT
ncbi:MAG TPA: hypothetical protein VGS41_17570, partial [Chthonomonadales bacterium]|nr:hypothetical protein [Chthonomonadales bacterium]